MDRIPFVIRTGLCAENLRRMGLKPIKFPLFKVIKYPVEPMKPIKGLYPKLDIPAERETGNEPV